MIGAFLTDSGHFFENLLSFFEINLIYLMSLNFFFETFYFSLHCNSYFCLLKNSFFVSSFLYFTVKCLIIELSSLIFF